VVNTCDNSSWYINLEGEFRFSVFLANGFFESLDLYYQEIVSEKSQSQQACKDSAESIIEWKREDKENILLS